jgi:hypothetical protein
MRRSFPDVLEKARLLDGAYASAPGESHGAFSLGELRIIATNGVGLQPVWEHVSVSAEARCPTWEEMCLVKELFWEDEETVLQIHPPKSKYVNFHPYTLHMWRRPSREFKLPPMVAV